MKKLILIIAIVFGLGMTSFADGGGLFQRGTTPDQESSAFAQGGVFKRGDSHDVGGNRIDDLPSLPPHNLPDTTAATGGLALVNYGGVALVLLLGFLLAVFVAFCVFVIVKLVKIDKTTKSIDEKLSYRK